MSTLSHSPILRARLVLGVVVVTALTHGLEAQVPQLISYQGRVVAEGSAFDGLGQFKFAFVNGGGTETFWSNDGTSSNGSEPVQAVSLPVNKGLFTLLLGDATMPHMGIIPATVFTNNDVWLRVWFGTGAGAFQKLSPDQRFAAVGYAFMAQNVADLSITSSKLAPGAVTQDKLAPGAVTADKLAPGSITGSQLAPFAVAQNLAAAGQSPVGSGGIILAEDPNSPDLVNAGYVRIGTAEIIRESWQMRLGPAPSARVGHSAVWTGTEMLVWGGDDGTVDRNGSAALLNDGGIYNPTLNQWRPMATNTILSPRHGHTAIWTGSRMIVYGGSTVSFMNGNLTAVPLGNGAIYDPVGDTWSPLLTAGGDPPQVGTGHSAVWTGTEMIVWGNNQGARYDPETRVWTTIPSPDCCIGFKAGHSAFWTGEEMLIWGGNDAGGARYHLASNLWTVLPVLPGPSVRQNASAVWTGTELLVWGGQDAPPPPFNAPGPFINGGARYRLASNTWAALPTTGAPGARAGQSAIWNGQQMVLWGGARDGEFLDDGFVFDPQSNHWSALPTAGAPDPRSLATALWTGTDLLVWGGLYATNRTWDNGGRYDFAGAQWRTLPTGGFPRRRLWPSAVWTGSEILFWGGVDDIPGTLSSAGVRYNPTTDVWTPMSTRNAPQGRIDHSAVWTGQEMIVWGGLTYFSGGNGSLGDGGRYDPESDSWTPLNVVGAPSPRAFHSAVWTGSEMVVFGGSLDQFNQKLAFYNDGAKYDPAQDTWVPLALAGAPTPRTAHAAAWTGTAMVVWGGDATNGTVRSDGASFDPTANQWTSITASNAPADLSTVRSVWTGQEFIVWGNTSGGLFRGARYNPTQDAWLPVSPTGGPGPRGGYTATWTGREVIILGGATDAGGRYDPTANSWQPLMLTGSPMQTTAGQTVMLQYHTATWTGSELIVAGGSGAFNVFRGAWRYVPPRNLYVLLRP